LGPKLFILYLFDVEKKLPEDCNSYFYCDDGTVTTSHKIENVMQEKCQTIMNDLNEWFAEHSLFLNAEKTKIIRFHSYQNPIKQLSINLNGVDVQKGGSVKFLGVNLDENLNWKDHCQSLTSKLNSIAYQFKNLRQVLDEKELIAVYYANCESHLRYGVGLWGWSTGSKDVFVSQKNVLRSLLGLGYTASCKEHFKRLGILTLPGIFIFELCVYVFNNKCKFVSNESFHGVNTRQKNNLREKQFRLEVTRKSPNYLGIKLYNTLPKSIQESENLEDFKKSLKKYLSKKNIYDVAEFVIWHV